MGLKEDIEAAKAQRGGTVPTAPVGFQPQGAPPAPSAAPAWGGPPPATPANAPPAFDPSFAFGAPPAAAPPPAAPAAPPIPPYGTETQNPEYITDGRGGYIAKNTLMALAAAGDTNARDYLNLTGALAIPAATPAPSAPAQETFPSHVNPPEASNPNLPTEAPKKGRGRPKAQTSGAPAVVPAEPRDTTPAPADFEGPELTVTLKLGRMVVSVPVPEEMSEALQAYVLKQVAG